MDPLPLGLRLKSNDLLKIFSNFLAICLSSMVKGFSIRVVLGLNSNFSDLYAWGLNYSITNGVITVSNTGCMADFTDKTLQLNVGINITIYCS